jgi:large subunit ribosomal protein L25
MDIKLKATSREIAGKEVKKLRKKDMIPAIIYGHGFDNLLLKVNRHDFSQVLKQAGESTIIDLDIEKHGVEPVLIHDLARDPVTDDILHIDFYRIKAGEKMTADIPLVFEGEAPAVEDLGGTLITNYRDIKISALPKNFPHDIKVDISLLETFEDQIKVSNLSAPEGVEILAEQDDVIALVSPPRTDEELEKLEEEVTEDLEKVEGISKEEDSETVQGEAAGKEEKQASSTDEVSKKDQSQEAKS